MSEYDNQEIVRESLNKVLDSNKDLISPSSPKILDN